MSSNLKYLKYSVKQFNYVFCLCNQAGCDWLIDHVMKLNCTHAVVILGIIFLSAHQCSWKPPIIALYSLWEVRLHPRFELCICYSVNMYEVLRVELFFSPDDTTIFVWFCHEYNCLTWPDIEKNPVMLWICWPIKITNSNSNSFINSAHRKTAGVCINMVCQASAILPG